MSAMMLVLLVVLGLAAVPALIFVLKHKANRLDREKAAVRGKKAPPALTSVDLVGSSGVVIGERLSADGGRIRVIDPDGHPRDIDAVLEDAPAPLKGGDEVLVITNPRQGRPATVVPIDLPALEDLSA